MQKQQAAHAAGEQRWEFYFSPIKYAIPIRIKTIPILIPIPISSPKTTPIPMGIPWEWESHLYSGATYDDHLRLIGKRVWDFLLVLIELFSLGVTAEALRANIGSKSAISLQRGPVNPTFQVGA